MTDEKQVPVPQGQPVKVLWKMPPECDRGRCWATWKVVELPASVAYIAVKDGNAEWMAPKPGATGSYVMHGSSTRMDVATKEPTTAEEFVDLFRKWVGAQMPPPPTA